jgi:hypothetical protein
MIIILASNGCNSLNIQILMLVGEGIPDTSIKAITDPPTLDVFGEQRRSVIPTVLLDKIVGVFIYDDALPPLFLLSVISVDRPHPQDKVRLQR